MNSLLCDKCRKRILDHLKEDGALDVEEAFYDKYVPVFLAYWTIVVVVAFILIFWC